MQARWEDRVRALISTAPGGPETLTLQDLPEPPLGAGQVLIEVRAIGVNYPDWLLLHDLYQLKPPRPFAPGGFSW
jgi:NADPH2:quinone reductase